MAEKKTFYCSIEVLDGQNNDDILHLDTFRLHVVGEIKCSELRLHYQSTDRNVTVRGMPLIAKVYTKMAADLGLIYERELMVCMGRVDDTLQFKEGPRFLEISFHSPDPVFWLMSFLLKGTDYEV